MCSPRLRHLFIPVLMLLFLSSPLTAAALDLIVEHNPTDASHFSGIQAAIDHARQLMAATPPGTETYRVVVKADPVPYHGNFTPVSNIAITGSETAGTFLDSYPYGTLISINNVSNVTISNLTITSTAVGIAVTNGSSITIANNIFRTVTTALQIQGSRATTVVNNTFYQNGTALSTDSDPLITNNIFAGNGTAIATGMNLSRLSYNAYAGNGSNGTVTLDSHSLPNSNAPNPDPLFVDPAGNDFHLQSGSPCHIHGGGNAGNPAYPNADNSAFFDMGAYGGPGSDTVPFAIQGFTASSAADGQTITLQWQPNTGYQIGGYHLYYGTAAGDRSGSGAAEGNSPVTVARGVNSATLSNLPLQTTTTPPAVSGVTLIPGEQILFVSWIPAANASRYKIYYSTTPFSANSLPATSLLVNGANSSGIYLEGLTNGATYYVAVAALSQSRYFLTLTAFTAGSSAAESSFAPEKVGYLGPYKESALSNVVSAVPAVQSASVGGFGSGIAGGGMAACFIATAAYGCYSAPQVQVLRDFRDRFLLTNAPGRVFVAWYYRHGPGWAAFITAHPWCKPLVRLLLLPLIGGAMVLLAMPLLTKWCIVAGLLLGGIYFRRDKTAAAGNRFLPVVKKRPSPQ